MIGISLPPAYLAGEHNDLLSNALGPPTTCLADLRQAGVQAIELQTIRPQTDTLVALEAARQVQLAGLRLTIHGQLPAGDSSGVDIYPTLLPICLRAVEMNERVIITVHSYQSKTEPTKVLVERTIRAILDMLNRAEHDALPIQLALELNRARHQNDPGTSYAQLLEMHSRIADPRVGFCWDLGHTLANARQGLMTTDAPVEFLRHVLQTHIHSLGPNDETHWPLTTNVSPLSSCLDSLASTDYTGVLNLELAAYRFAESIGVRKGIFDSIANLTSLLAAVKANRK